MTDYKKNAQRFSELFKAWSFYFEKGQLDMQAEQQFKFDFQKPFRAMFSGMFADPMGRFGPLFKNDA